MKFERVKESFKHWNEKTEECMIKKPFRWFLIYTLLMTFFPLYMFLIIVPNIDKNNFEFLFIFNTFLYLILASLSINPILLITDKIFNLDKYFSPDRKNKIIDMQKIMEVYYDYQKKDRRKFSYILIAITFVSCFLTVCILSMSIISLINLKLNILENILIGGFLFALYGAFNQLLIPCIIYLIINPPLFISILSNVKKEYFLTNKKKAVWIGLFISFLVFFIFVSNTLELYMWCNFPLFSGLLYFMFYLASIGLSILLTSIVLFLKDSDNVKPEIKTGFLVFFCFTVLFLPCFHLIYVPLNHLTPNKFLYAITAQIGIIYTLVLVLSIFLIKISTNIFKNTEKIISVVSTAMILSAVSLYAVEHFQLYEYSAKIAFINQNKKQLQTKSPLMADFIVTKDKINKMVEFHYYIPQKAIADKKSVIPLMLVLSGTNSKGQDTLSSQFKDFAEKEGFVLISPTFILDHNGYYNETCYYFPAVWSGNALLSMIDKLKKQENFSFSKLYLLGASAGAQYSLRFTLWKPDFCIASATHGNGGDTIIPKKLNSVKYFISVGIKDAKFRHVNVETFYKNAKKLGIDIKYRTYPVGHGLFDPQIKDSLQFFKQLNDKYDK